MSFQTTNSNSLLPNTASNDIQQHVYSANSGDVDTDNDSQSDCHSDSNSCAPEIMVPDARVFSSINKSTAHGCWTLDFFVSDIKLQAIYKVIHTFNYDGHISKYVCKIGKYNQRGIIFSCNTILVHMKLEAQVSLYRSPDINKPS